MIVTEHWAECVCGSRERTEAADTYPPAWLWMIDSNGKHFGCTRGCLMLLMADPTAGRKQIAVPLPTGMVQADLKLLELLALDYQVKEIASAVGLSYYTIKNRLSDIYHALGARTRTSALLLAHARGLISLPRLSQTSAERVGKVA